MALGLKYTILIVDDSPGNIDILVGYLKESYSLKVATDGDRALKVLSQGGIDMVLLDIMMPKMDGFEVCEKIMADEKLCHLPVIFLTAKDSTLDEEHGLKLGAVDYITKPFNPSIVKARVRNHLELKAHRDQLEVLISRRTNQLVQTQDAMIEAIGTMAEYRDTETGGHIKRTQRYVKLLAEKLQNHPRFRSFLTDQNISSLFKSAPLHDVGKVAVPDAILLKPDKLTPGEFEIMKQHTVFGHDVIHSVQNKLGGGSSFLRIAKEIAYGHQERFDGSGYPLGRKGEEIPISARLMTVADVYDALISKRVYKPAFPHAKAVEIILNGDGRTHPHHFDPDILEAFKSNAEEFRMIAFDYADFDEEKEALSPTISPD